MRDTGTDTRTHIHTHTHTGTDTRVRDTGTDTHTHTHTQALNHPHIIKLYEVVEAPRCKYLIMQAQILKSALCSVFV